MATHRTRKRAGSRDRRTDREGRSRHRRRAGRPEAAQHREGKPALQRARCSRLLLQGHRADRDPEEGRRGHPRQGDRGCDPRLPRRHGEHALDRQGSRSHLAGPEGGEPRDGQDVRDLWQRIPGRRRPRRPHRWDPLQDRAAGQQARSGARGRQGRRGPEVQQAHGAPVEGSGPLDGAARSHPEGSTRPLQGRGQVQPSHGGLEQPEEGTSVGSGQGQAQARTREVDREGHRARLRSGHGPGGFRRAHGPHRRRVGSAFRREERVRAAQSEARGRDRQGLPEHGNRLPGS